MFYAYCSAERPQEQEVEKELQHYAKTHNFQYTKMIQDVNGNKQHWEKRQLHSLISHASAGDSLVVFEASDLACSTLQVLEVLDLLSARGVTLHLVKYGQVFSPEKVYDTEKFITLFKCIEGEFVTKRTTDALARRRAAGLPLGRPRGRKNKSRKLDKFRVEIKKYLALDINKASIAKLVGCHAQTLYNYLEDTDLVQEVEAEKKALLDNVRQGMGSSVSEVLS